MSIVHRIDDSTPIPISEWSEHRRERDQILLEVGDSKGLVRAPSNASLVGRNTQDKPTDTQKHTTRRAVPACTAQTAVHASQQQLPSGAEGNVHPPAPAHASPSAPEPSSTHPSVAATHRSTEEVAQINAVAHSPPSARGVRAPRRQANAPCWCRDSPGVTATGR